MEPDSTAGKETIPDANTCVHLESTEQEDLMNAKEDWVYKLEEGTARENTSVEEDRDPCIELQEPGVSYLATQENTKPLTLSSLPPPITLEAARTQCLPAVNTGTLATPEPEDHSADLELQPYDMPTNKAIEPCDHLPKQIQAPTDEGEMSESFWGEQTWHVMSQTGLTSMHTLEGMMLIGEAHGCPPEIPDLLMQGSTIWEPEFNIPKACVCMHQAQKPVLDKGAHMCPDLWPSLTVIIVNLDAYFRSAALLEGEQNISLPCAGSKQYTAQPTPHISSFSSLPHIPSPPDTPTCEYPPEEGAATEWHATDDHYPEPQKPPDTQAEDLHKSGGASVSDDLPILPGGLGDPDPFGLPGVAENADTGEVKPLHVDACE